MSDFTSLSPVERRRALGAWYLLAGHRAVWNFPLFFSISIFVMLLILRGTGEDPAENLKISSAAIAALQPPEIPDEENAAVAYNKAFAITSRFTGPFEDDPCTFCNRDSALFGQPQVAAYLQSNVGSIAALRFASRLDKCNWKSNYAAGVGMMLTYLSQLRAGARLLAADARVSAHAGDHAAAAADLKAMYRMAQHCETDPLLINSLVSIAITSIADSTLEAIVIWDTPTTASDIEEYRKALWLNRDPNVRGVRTMEGEKTFMLYTTDAEMMKVATTGVPTPGLGAPSLPGGAMPWYGADRRCCEKVMDEIIANMKSGNFKANQDIEGIVSRHQTGPTLFSGMLMPVLGRSHESLIRSAEQGALADAALAFLLFRARHGRDPRALDELAPEFLSTVPGGIFSLGPIKMRIDPAGIKFKPKYKGMGKSRAIRTEKLNVHPGVIRIYTLGKNGLDELGYSEWSDEDYTAEDGTKIWNMDDSSFRIPPAQAAPARGEKDRSSK